MHPPLGKLWTSQRNAKLITGRTNGPNHLSRAAAFSDSPGNPDNPQKSLGVAKGIQIIPVKVTQCSSLIQINYASALAAVDWVLWDMQQSYNANRRGVANMSWFFNVATQDVTALETKISDLVAAGIVVTTSANNQGQNLCGNQSPARLGHGYWWLNRPPRYTITVGGLDQFDERFVCDAGVCSGESNVGPCVDIYAPAEDIRIPRLLQIRENDPQATWFNVYQDDTNFMSGTSYASAIAAGVAARVLHLHPTWTAEQVWDEIRNTARPLESNFDGDDYFANDLRIYRSALD